MLALVDPTWANLTHAYGSAAGTPDLLRAVAREPAVCGASQGPWYDLWSALCHQGDVYPASFAAVPHFVSVIESHPEQVSFDFFLLPAAIEVARHIRSVAVPVDLHAAYSSALDRIPKTIPAVAVRAWDALLCRSILAAVAAAKGDLASAELLLEIDEGETAAVLEWYRSR